MILPPNSRVSVRFRSGRQARERRAGAVRFTDRAVDQMSGKEGDVRGVLPTDFVWAALLIRRSRWPLKKVEAVEAAWSIVDGRERSPW